MKFKDYFFNKITEILGTYFVLFLMLEFLYIIGNTFSVVFMIGMVIAILIMTKYLMDWYRKKKYFEMITERVKDLKEPWLIAELLPVSYTIEDEIYQELLRKVGSSAIEEIHKIEDEQKEYEDYIEAWAHEIKIPLSLMTLVLENRREDMSAPVYEKMNYTNCRMQDYVTQMLYYARLKAVHKDYVMEMVSLEEVCEDVVEEYTEYVDAQSIHWRVQVGKEQVLTDRKGLHFMLEQILNNACKYKDAGKETSYIEMTTVVGENRIWLQIKDNGVGAEEAELPFLLDKGFTGKTVMGQAKATGMGLYLVAQMAKDLSLHIDIESKVGESFIIRIGFPVISR